MSSVRSSWLGLACALVACGGKSESPATSTDSASDAADASVLDAAADDTGGDVSSGDVAPDVPVALDALDAASSDASKSAGCVATFGTALPSGYGRIDGTVVAVVPPGDKVCTASNRDHIVLEVRMGGAVYRMVVNVVSTVAGVSPDVLYEEVPHELPPPAWADGFHAPVTLDYATTLGLHSTDPSWKATPMATLVDEVTAALDVGAKVSVYSQGSGGESTHLVHRYGGNTDGAIVVDPTGSPRFLVFHFANDKAF
jgi:hypothetical protein